ncbi:MAG: P1 family peptidase, partial [Solirubrobacterales bacterium]|nr:P1 family peptidase [Solirubrobacterales bacterium]
VASGEVRGGAPASRELALLAPQRLVDRVDAVVLSGRSVFGLAAADGVVRWLEERGRGRATPAGVVPIVPSAVVFDLIEGSSARRPGPDEGYAACAAATDERAPGGLIGAGVGTAVGKLLGRERATPGGLGYATVTLGDGTIVAALAVANAFGDVIGADGELLGAPRNVDRKLVRSADLLPRMPEVPEFRDISESATGNTTLACVCTDASVDKRTCAIVARMASAGIARAVDPAFTPLDGDVVFCLASGSEPPLTPGLAASWSVTVLGAAAATVTAGAIRDAIRRSA